MALKLSCFLTMVKFYGLTAKISFQIPIADISLIVQENTLEDICFFCLPKPKEPLI